MWIFKSWSFIELNETCETDLRDDDKLFSNRFEKDECCEAYACKTACWDANKAANEVAYEVAYEVANEAANKAANETANKAKYEDAYTDEWIWEKVINEKNENDE